MTVHNSPGDHPPKALVVEAVTGVSDSSPDTPDRLTRNYFPQPRQRPVTRPPDGAPTLKDTILILLDVNKIWET